MVYWQSWSGNASGKQRIDGLARGLGGRVGALRDRFVAGLEQAVEIAAGASACARRLDPPIEFPPLGNYTVGDAVTHIAMHNVHHLGQIVTLRQIQGAWPPPEGSYTW
jgi:DinB superfamily